MVDYRNYRKGKTNYENIKVNILEIYNTNCTNEESQELTTIFKAVVEYTPILELPKKCNICLSNTSLAKSPNIKNFQFEIKRENILDLTTYHSHDVFTGIFKNEALKKRFKISACITDKTNETTLRADSFFIDGTLLENIVDNVSQNFFKEVR